MENLGDAYDLSGKTALITGSRKGIGFAIARTLSQAGANVVINGTVDPNRSIGRDRAQEAANGGDACYCQSDLAKPRAAATLFEEALLPNRTNRHTCIQCFCSTIHAIHGGNRRRHRLPIFSQFQSSLHSYPARFEGHEGTWLGSRHQ